MGACKAELEPRYPVCSDTPNSEMSLQVEINKGNTHLEQAKCPHMMGHTMCGFASCFQANSTQYFDSTVHLDSVHPSNRSDQKDETNKIWKMLKQTEGAFKQNLEGHKLENLKISQLLTKPLRYSNLSAAPKSILRISAAFASKRSTQAQTTQMPRNGARENILYNGKLIDLSPQSNDCKVYSASAFEVCLGSRIFTIADIDKDQELTQKEFLAGVADERSQLEALYDVEVLLSTGAKYSSMNRTRFVSTIILPSLLTNLDKLRGDGNANANGQVESGEHALMQRKERIRRHHTELARAQAAATARITNPLDVVLDSEDEDSGEAETWDKESLEKDNFANFEEHTTPEKSNTQIESDSLLIAVLQQIKAPGEV